MTGSFSAEFRGASTPVGEVRFFSTEGLGSYKVDEATGIFQGGSEELTTFVRNAAPGEFLLLKDVFSGISPHNTVASFHQPEQNEMGLTRERNTHGLEFGQLVMSSDYDYQRIAQVVLKPFDQAREAVHEFAVTDFINRDNPQRPFRGLHLLGFYRYESGDIALMTEYEHPILSYDSLFWNIDREPTVQELNKAFGHCALAMGLEHQAMITDGDAQVKNYAADNKGIRLIDFEHSQGFPVRDGAVDAEATRSKIIEDLDTFVNSLNAGIEDPADYRDYGEYVEGFARRYAYIADVANSRIPQAARITADEIVRLAA